MLLYETISDYYEIIFPLRENKISFIKGLLKQNKSKILDIGCSTGDLSLALARLGHEVTGIDLDEAMIKKAQKKPKKLGDICKFQIKDMVEIGKDFQDETFDAVFCLGNTLVHLKNLEEIDLFLKNVFCKMHFLIFWCNHKYHPELVNHT